jgi:hypothetical protein
VCLKLAKSGYCGSDPMKIVYSPTDWVLKMYHYEMFLSNYKEASEILNEQK